jgi:hypothetical protein
MKLEWTDYLHIGYTNSLRSRGQLTDFEYGYPITEKKLIF